MFALDDYGDRAARDVAMADWLADARRELVVCAGYMHLLTPGFLDRFDAVINVHPSLLPAFPGLRPLEDALAAGIPETGVTVHFVDEGIDTGPVILQERGRRSSPATRPRRFTRACTRSSTGCCPKRRASIWQANYALLAVLERALLSVFDKTGLDVFARELHELGIELVASGGTATFVKELGLPVTRVDDLTEIPELLGGRVKTLHPKIHAAILARRDNEDDVAALEEHAIDPFDLVCVNLYPFQQVAARKDVREEEAVEMIDVGGPSMLRAAAKNFIHVVPVCSIDRYGSIVAELKERGDIGMAARRALAAEAFAHTASYEASIAQWFSDRETFPDRLHRLARRVVDLPYGENPHQRASYYAEAGARRHLLSRVDQLGGKQVSFNNLNDLDAARGAPAASSPSRPA